MATSSSSAAAAGGSETGTAQANEKPVYTRRCVPRLYPDVMELDETFDEGAWEKKAYGPDVIIVARTEVPNGWILVDSISPYLFISFLSNM